MGAAESVLRNTAADVDVAVSEALDSLRGVQSAREKGWKATGIVSLRDAKLRELPSSVVELGGAVKTLDAANNRLAALPPALSALTGLQRLVLSQNAIACLPPALCSLTCLKVLLLDGNALTSLPADLGALSKLEKLSVAGNRLTALPESLGALPALRSLCVARNALATLPPSLRGCGALEELDASGNSLSELPGELGQLTRLRVLLLDDNALRTLPSPLLLGCTSLSTLSLHGNPVQMNALEQTAGWTEMQARTQGKNAKRVAGGVLLGQKGLDDGLDHQLTRVVVPHT